MLHFLPDKFFTKSIMSNIYPQMLHILQDIEIRDNSLFSFTVFGEKSWPGRLSLRQCKCRNNSFYYALQIWLR